MSRRTILNKNNGSIGQGFKSLGWNELRQFAKGKGIKTYGLSRDEIEAELMKISGRG